MRKPYYAVIAIVALLFIGVAAAQGSGGSTPTAATPAACASPVAATPAAAASPAAVASPAACASPVAETTAAAPAGVSVHLEDIYFDPATLTIPANTPVVITVTNEGSAVHTFNIDALKIDTGDVSPGSSVKVTVNAPAGTYQYYCAIPGHREAGMVGTLTVK